MSQSGWVRLKLWALVSLLALRPQPAQTETSASLKLVGYLRPVASLSVTRAPAASGNWLIVTRGEPYKITLAQMPPRPGPAAKAKSFRPRPEGGRAWLDGRPLTLRARALPIFGSAVANGPAVHHQLRAREGAAPLQLTFIQN